MLVVHNIVGAGERLKVIEPKPYRKFAFGSLLAYADGVYERAYEQRLLSSSLALPGDLAVYGKDQLQGIAVGERYDSVVCHLVLDHGGVVTEDFFSTLRADFLKAGGRLLNPVKSIAKNDVARASRFELETQTAPCVIKKNDNYNRPETVLRMATQAELDDWRARTPAEEQSQFVVHKVLEYFGMEEARLYQLERWIVLFDDLTVNYRCSDEFYVKTGTSLSYYVRDERRMPDDLGRLADSGYDWKGRSIDCAYNHDPDAWDARYAVLKDCREAFGFDYAELDVLQPAKNQFVVIDVNITPGPSYKNVYFRELAVRVLADGLGIRPGNTAQRTGHGASHPPPSTTSHDATEPDESLRRARLLEEQLARNPDDAHGQFLLAQAYREAGRLEQALAAYRKRVSIALGSDEERFVAQLEVGRLSVRLDAPEAAVLGELLRAYNLRPLRAEPLYELARYYRMRKGHAMATLFAKAGVETPRPDDRLFVVESVYTWQMLDELGAAALLAGDYVSAKEACQTLLERVEGGLAIPPEDSRRIRECLAQASAKLGPGAPSLT
jgi:tetratricopeptide (TPR) repeat protein